MIEIKPNLKHQSACPYCKTILKPQKVLWMGMNIGVESVCQHCDRPIMDELRIGHAAKAPYSIDLQKGVVFCEDPDDFLAKPALQALQHPKSEPLEIRKEVFKQCDRVIILNCIDFLYGHSLLKLLNIQRHLENNPDLGLIVIVQKFLRWMVPEGVAEVWTVPYSLKNGRNYYLSFAEFVDRELERFKEVYVSESYSHPSQYDITKFTRVPKHDFTRKDYRITFVWREDRLWGNYFLYRVCRKLNLLALPLGIQNQKVVRLFQKLREELPDAKFTVAGLGKRTTFPDWIADFRVHQFDEKTEQQTCQIYSESRLVIGIHGSNMLLPSGHAGMTIDMMMEDRWGNFAQDILYQEKDPRLASFRYRYVPLKTSLPTLVSMASEMFRRYSEFCFHMTGDRQTH